MLNTQSLKLRLEKAVNGYTITFTWSKIPDVTIWEKTSVFLDINSATNCFSRLSQLLEDGRMTIVEFVNISSEYTK